MKNSPSLNVSDSLLEIVQEVGCIRRLERFQPALYSLTLELPEIAGLAKPGQFVHLQIEGLPDVLLRRPFSIAAIEGDLVRLIIRIVGRGTAGLANFQLGDYCNVIGPLGKGFTFDKVQNAFLLGGGIGTAPLMFLQDEISKAGIPARFFVGSRTKADFPLEVDDIWIRRVEASTDDGSFGLSGFVTASLEAALQEGTPHGAQVYSCGPLPMMKEADRICREYSLPHQVSLESRMGCGIGVCQGCALKIGESSDRGGFRLICVDGPVFDARMVDWSSLT
ncbi:MAG: dihydroorotate dehydrogenase electron transfer subunit [bacterium]|nr:dihydroorotate dehydrogenase electron transfer subunit [bacterium]